VARDPGVGALPQRKLPNHVLDAQFGDTERSNIPGMLRRLFQTKAQQSCANCNNAYGYRNPLGGAGVYIPSLGHPSGASSWSSEESPHHIVSLRSRHIFSPLWLLFIKRNTIFF
jgi:hypothetical protein